MADTHAQHPEVAKAIRPPAPPRGGKTPAAAPADGAPLGGWEGFLQYLRDVRAEIPKVTWPNQTDWTNSSVITILTILGIAAIMAGLNAIFSYFAAYLFGA